MSEKKITKYFRGKVRSIDPDKKTAEVVISDETKDRYDERVLVSSFKKTKKNFMEHAVLLSSHAYRGLLNHIGEFKKLVIDEKEKEVVGTVQYYHGLGNPEADWAWVLAEKGIAAFSVGFIPKVYKDFNEEERAKNGGVWREYEDIELLEVSQVLVPANPSALQRSFGDADDLFLKDLHDRIVETLKDVEDGIEWQDSELTEEEKDTESLKELTTEEVLTIIGGMIQERHVAVTEQMKLLTASWEEMKSVMLSMKATWEEMKSLMEEKEVSLGQEGKETEQVEKEEKAEGGEDQESLASLEEVLGPEKIAELRGTLFGYEPKDDDSLKKLFEEMTAEVKEKLSVQS